MLCVQEKTWMQQMRAYLIVFYQEGKLVTEEVLSPDVVEASNMVRDTYKIPIAAILHICMIP